MLTGDLHDLLLTKVCSVRCTLILKPVRCCLISQVGVSLVRVILASLGFRAEPFLVARRLLPVRALSSLAFCLAVQFWEFCKCDEMELSGYDPSVNLCPPWSGVSPYVLARQGYEYAASSFGL